jgi:hypothetical protein
MNASGVSLNTKGLQALKRSLKKSVNVATQVGIFSGHASRDDGQTNVEIGQKMEFGSVEKSTASPAQKQARGRPGKAPIWKGNPARSFLVMPVTTELPDLIKKERAELASDYVNHGATFLMERIGFLAEASIQGAFDTQGYGTWEPNAKKTVEWKGSNKPLIDSDQLRRSISSRVKTA